MAKSSALPASFDVLVVGAGTTGAAAAALLSMAGHRVGVIERRRLEAAGARWINDVPPWIFEAAGLRLPTPPELHTDHHPMRMFGEGGRGGLRLPRRPMWGIDCRRLVSRLQELAREHGATFLEETSLSSMECAGQRPTTARLRRKLRGKSGESITLSASLFVDASGLAGALRSRVPTVAAACPEPALSDRVSASQQIRTITDPAVASAFLDGLNAQTDEFLVWSGLEGGYSTRVVRVAPDLRTVDLLTGVMCERDPSGGPRSIEAFVDAQPWIGKAELAGSAVIPVRRPYDRLGFPGAVLLGEAACQTFPGHGSGVGAGLLAARALADALAGQSDPGSPEATWAYAAASQRDRGAVSAGYDVFRRAMQATSGPEVRRLIDAGLMTEDAALQALEQRMPRTQLGELPSLLTALRAAPGPGLRFSLTAARMFAVHALYRRYPQSHDLTALRRWSRQVSRLAGWRPDPV